MTWLNTIEDALATVPGGVWAAALVTTLIASIITLPLARRRAYRAGQLAANPDTAAPGERAENRALFIASLVPAVLFWALVLAGSFRGLTAFGRDVLNWRDGWEYIVPGTLDGVAIAFGFLAFRAISRERSPDRANRVVWGSAIASAVINYAHEAGRSGTVNGVEVHGSPVGGAYLALLSLFGMIMFHEFLEQFGDGTAYIRRDNPKWGLRWLTSPWETWCAWLAWRNYPPADGTEATVNTGLRNLRRARRIKQLARSLAVARTHDKELAAARRAGELAVARAAAKAAPPAPPARPPAVPAPTASISTSADVHSTPHPVPAPQPQPVMVPAQRPDGALTVSVEPTATVFPQTAAGDVAGREPRLPKTAEACAEWMSTWVRLITNAPDFAAGRQRTITTEASRAAAGCAERQARLVRDAARSGLLRQQAEQLQLAVPDGYLDRPEQAHPRINGAAYPANTGRR